VKYTFFKAIAIILILIGSFSAVYQSFSFVKPTTPLYFGFGFAVVVTIALAIGLLMHKLQEGKMLIACSTGMLLTFVAFAVLKFFGAAI
jgi:hypothetical protein